MDLVRSFISFTQTQNEFKPPQNNEEVLQILENIQFSRLGAVKSGGNKTYIEFKSVRIIEFNTTRMTFEKVNQDTPEAQEYNKLVKDLLNNNNRLIGKISSETKQDQTKVVQTINYQEFSYPEMTEEQIRDLVRNKEAVKPTLNNIERLRQKLDNIDIDKD